MTISTASEAMDLSPTEEQLRLLRISAYAADLNGQLSTPPVAQRRPRFKFTKKKPRMASDEPTDPEARAAPSTTATMAAPVKVNIATHALVCPGAPAFLPPPPDPYRPGAPIAASQVPPPWPGAVPAPEGAPTTILRRIRNDFGRDYWIVRTRVVDARTRAALEVRPGVGRWIAAQAWALSGGRWSAGVSVDVGHARGRSQGVRVAQTTGGILFMHGVADADMQQWVEVGDIWRWEEGAEKAEVEGSLRGYWGCKMWALRNADKLII